MNHAIVFTTNKEYLPRFYFTCKNLRTVGNYNEDIILMLGNDLSQSDIDQDFIQTNKLIIFKLPTMTFDPETLRKIFSIPRDYYWNLKFFQYHKFNLFHPFFKQWKYIFYMDCGINILNDITPMLSLFKPGKIVAHSDAYPLYEWKLKRQFDSSQIEFKELITNYNLDIDYFQTTILLYDTSIITDRTVFDLMTLVKKYPLSITNDQGIIALYFRNQWSQIPIKNDDTYFYDYMKRNSSDKYIMVKSL
jgi:hypothetical protein